MRLLTIDLFGVELKNVRFLDATKKCYRLLIVVAPPTEVVLGSNHDNSCSLV